MEFLNIFDKKDPAILQKDKLIFNPLHTDRRFKVAMDESIKRNIETTILLERSCRDGQWFSITLRNPQGFLRTVLENRSLSPDRSGRRMIVELRMAAVMVEGAAVSALCDTLELTDLESELVHQLIEDLLADDRDPFALSAPFEPALCTVLQKAGCASVTDLVRLLFSLSPLCAERPQFAASDWQQWAHSAI